MNLVAAQIYDFILYKVSVEEFIVGVKIPTEKALSEKFSTNRMNAHYAIKKLEQDGVVVRNKKQGTQINPLMTKKQILDLRNIYSKSVYVLATLSDAKNIHWDESVISALEQELSNKGYSVIHQDLPCDHDSFREAFSNIMESGARAVFILPDHNETLFLLENQDLLEKDFTDIYLLNRGVDTFHRISCHILNLDPFDEGVMTGEHLWEKGFREIIFAATDCEGKYFWSEERKAGAGFGIKIISEGKDDLSILNMAKEDLLSKLYIMIKTMKGKVAIIAQNDKLAIEIIKYMQSKDLHMPGDFGIIGFDNDILGRKFGLSSVAPPSDRLGELFSEMMLQANWRKSNGIKMSLKLKSNIIDRRSTETIKNDKYFQN